ncbi:hypothetical protein [Aureivirga marina]|uniref:hypothetical protein n=1 Tax=Aureivirga marina TaxID=1182451 RepID=UPI0018CACA08|nr:hypothetical protein [Aureivirga marina]
MKYFYLIFMSFLLISCAKFKKLPTNYKKIDRTNIASLNGEYSIFAKNQLATKSPYFHNANNKFYRKAGRGISDTIHFDSISGGIFKINVLNKEKVKFEFIKKGKIVRSQTLKYKLKKDGFMHIKNRNTILIGVPYIFGGVDHRKVRIALDTNNNLILNDIFDSSGSLLLIFGDAKVWEELNIYEKLKIPH